MSGADAVRGGVPAASADAIRIGIDIGGTGTRVVAVRERDLTVVGRHALPTPAGPLTTADAIAFAREARLAVAGDRPVSGMGIGASGPVDAEGVVQNPHTLPAFTGLALGPLVEDALGIRCVVDSDAVAAALAESRVGAGVGASDLLHVTLGTGIGVAVVRAGRPVLGADGFQPEAGHLDVPDDSGPACYCGRAQCWEQTASRRALQRLAEVTDVAGVDAAATAPGSAVFARYGRSLGLGLRTLVTVLRPTRVVLGGGAARWFDAYAPAVRVTVAEVEQHGLPFDLRPTLLDDDGGAVGAALLLDV